MTLRWINWLMRCEYFLLISLPHAVWQGLDWTGGSLERLPNRETYGTSRLLLLDAPHGVKLQPIAH